MIVKGGSKVELAMKENINKSLEYEVKLAKKGDKKAFISLIKSCEKSLYRVAKGILSKDEDCEDAIQETIIKAYESIINLKKNQYFKTWIIKILINECRKIYNSQKRIVSIDKLKEDGVEDNHGKLEVREAINKLSEELRVPTILFYYEDISVKDISKIMDIPEGTVKSRLSRARSKLQEHLEYRGIV